MMTTEQVQENYAIAAGYECFNDLIEADLNALDWHVSNVQKIYAKKVSETILMDVTERLSKLKESEGGLSLDEFHEIVNTPIQLP